MTIVAIVSGILLGAGALCALYRVVRGPTVLDRVIASDVLVATAMCALGADMALRHHIDTLPVLLVLALFAVLGSLSVARFIPRQDSE